MGSITSPTSSPRRPFAVRRGTRSVTAVTVAALALAACSAGDGGGSQPDPQASYSQDQVVSALNSVAVDGQKLSAEPVDEDGADSQMEDLG